MSFIYPRTISISRPTQPVGVGAVGYGGELTSTETPIASSVAASIQYKRRSGGTGDNIGLPGDVERSGWAIFFNLPLGTVNVRDVITDDQGARYSVSANYWNSLGYRCECTLLNT